MAEDFQEVQEQFAKFAGVYCYECHGPQNAEAELDLKALIEGPEGLAAHTEALELVYDAVDFEDMPPSKYEHQPSDEERAAAIAQILGMKKLLEQQTLNDPGLVVMPRLTRSEYDRVIRDITGQPISVSHILPDEGGAGEGFSNVGEAHSISIMQIEKYLDASKLVLEHLIATPDGWFWADRPLKEARSQQEIADNMKKAVQRIFSDLEMRIRVDHLEALKDSVEKEIRARSADGDVPGHQRDLVKNADHVLYLEGAWRYLHRAELGLPEDLEVIAKSVHPELRADVLQDFLTAFESATNPEAPGLLKDRVAALQALPGPDQIGDRFAMLEKLYTIQNLWTRPPTGSNRHWTQNHFPDYEVSNQRVQEMQDDLKAQRWPFKIKLEDKERFDTLFLVVTTAADGSEGDLVHWIDGSFELEDGSQIPWDEALRSGAPTTGEAEVLKQDGQTILAAASPAVIKLPVPENAKFFSVTAQIPDEAKETATVQVIIRPTEPDEKDLFYYDKRHPLGHWNDTPVIAGWYKQMNAAQEYFRERNSGLLTEERSVFQFLDQNTQKALGIANVAEKVEEDNFKDQYPYYFSVPTLRALASPEELTMLEHLESLMTALAGRMSSDQKDDPAELRQIARQQVTEFMTLAWRRYVSEAEVEEMLRLYDEIAVKKGTTYEESVKLALTGVLMSPYFIYRYPVNPDEPVTAGEVVPLTSHELASRLSFALWASIPDPELLELAEQNKLRDPQVLITQARRMLKDPRAAAMSEEFSAQWFRFANFENFSEPDTTLFTKFGPKIAEAMYQEMRHFFLDLIQENRSILNVLEADYTYVNEPLARYYGMDADALGLDGPQMQRVAVDPDERGGILGMGAVLTRNSAPQRTSPVKRGVWVFEEILGGHIPNPPPNVPPLSDGERNEAGQTVVEQLAQHRDDPACYSCHAKFDPLGIALENFDPVGRWREVDSAGEPLATEDELSDGTRLTGFQDLRNYLVGRQDEFVSHFCRKLLGYMLGRGVELGDRPLLDEMKSALAENDYRFESALVVVLESPQFLNRRVQPNLEAATDSTEDNPNS